VNNLLFATNNPHKLTEIREILEPRFNILSLKDIHCADELPETQNTLEGNALQKAQYVYDKYHFNCFADDTGLEIEALNGAPGVFSARFAGNKCTYDDNVNKVLHLLENLANRKARFRTVIALILNKKIHFFEGTVEGHILQERKGTSGFGYDPIFVPHGTCKTFAEMTSAEKNIISHRGLALNKLTQFLIKA